LPLIRRASPELEKISTPWHLLDQLARERLRASHLTGSVDGYLNELAAVAHRFYDPKAGREEAVGFNVVELRDFLGERNPMNVDDRVATLLNHTLIAFPSGVSDEDRFEMPVWGWFFTAYHLANSLKLSSTLKEPVLRAFGKPFAPEVMEFCEEMLDEWMPRHEDTILSSLRAALDEDAEPEMKARQRQVARGQLAELRHSLE
jgi:hypothetical protein